VSNMKDYIASERTALFADYVFVTNCRCGSGSFNTFLNGFDCGIIVVVDISHVVVCVLSANHTDKVMGSPARLVFMVCTNTLYRTFIDDIKN
jgi:hypothetical protein